MRKPKKLLASLMLAVLFVGGTSAQVVTFGPAVPATTADFVHTCFGSSDFSVTFSNSSVALSNASVEIKLSPGISYVPGSFSFTTNQTAKLIEGDLSDLNNPEFILGSLSAGEIINLTIGRVGDCSARSLKIAGNTFRDSTYIFEGGVEVGYSNGVAEGSATYDVVYAALSITNVNTNPSPANIGSSAIRSMEITNGSFGSVDTFTWVEQLPAGTLVYDSFFMNPAGSNYPIPSGNVIQSGDSLIISFSAAEIAAIDGSGGTDGDGDSFFEIDEKFILQYIIQPQNCGVANSINSDLSVFWGCSPSVCQTGTNTANLPITTAIPTLKLSHISAGSLDFCDTVTYSARITNNSTETNPAGGSFAKDVIIFMGLRANQTPVATLANMTMWSPEFRNTRIFGNYKIGDSTIVPLTMLGVYNKPVAYIPANHFDSDPDGPGGLDDLDGDGYYDDLAKDEFFEFSFDVNINPKSDTCGLGREDYMIWEHIAADINWSNQCGLLMTPKRQEFNYTNFIRDYNNSTFLDAPTDVVDAQDFEASIKPHMYNTIACNGKSGLTGSDVHWTVRAIMPPGIIVDPDYDATKFTVSGDTIFTTGPYSYSFTDFPLRADCASWNNVNPMPLTLQTVYECKDGGLDCFSQEMHCVNIPIYMHCGSSCSGVQPLTFSSLRTSGSWTDTDQDTLVDMEDSAIEREVVYPYDTVKFTMLGSFVDTMSENLYLRINYSLVDTIDIFEYVSGEVTIKDVDGQYNGGTTSYTIPLGSAPTVNYLGDIDFEMIFDLSSYRTSVDADYKFGQSASGPPSFESDSVMVEAFFTINTKFAAAIRHKVTGFRSEFYIMNSGLEVSCSSWGSNLDYNKVSYNLSATQNYQYGCNVFFQNFYFTHRSNTGDDHPDEYRPPSHFDSMHIQIPDGYDIGEIRFYDNSVLTSSWYSFVNNSLKIYRPDYYNELDKRATYYPNIKVEMIPTCEVVAGRNDYDLTLYYKDFAYQTNTANHNPVITSLTNGFVDYTAPSFNITPIQTNKAIYEDQVSWVVDLCNGNSSSDIDYNWLIMSSSTSNVTVDSVHDISSGTAVTLPFLTRIDGSQYLEIGDLLIGECASFEIFATHNSCNLEELTINHGWGCGGYSLPNEAVACSASTAVFVENKGSQISTTITDLPNTPADPSDPTAGNWGSSSVDMCQAFPSEIRVVNAQSGNLFDVNVSLSVPAGGLGLDYVAGSATIEVEGIDAVNVPRSIGAAAEAALVAASSANQATWSVSLADLDPTNFGSDEPLQGIDNLSQNEFILRWSNQTTCDIASGENYVITVNGTEYCGAAAEGSGEYVQGFPINVNGVVPSYITAMNGSLSPDINFDGCNDLKTFTMDLFISGGITQQTDTVIITLAEGLGYGAGLICNTPGKCPTFVSNLMVGAKEEVRFAYSSGHSGNINFEFDVITADRGSCATNSTIAYRSENVLPGISCGAGSCPLIKAITGSGTDNAALSKPILNVALNALEYTGPVSNPLYEYEIEISNSGIDTENDIIVDFYCLNAAGDDIQGPSLHKDTLQGVLANAGMQTLLGTFSSTCDPSLGVAVIVTPEYDNCYCNALDNLADKSAGLVEIPHAKMSNVPLPIVIASFTVREKDCEIWIDWSTASEEENELFIVEKSIDGRNFEPIASINGAGNSAGLQNYQYVDRGNYMSSNLYYRIKQVDFDGTYAFSDTEKIRRSNCEGKASALQVQPNLVEKGKASVDVLFNNNDGHERASLQVYAYTGQLIYEAKNIELNFDFNKMEIPLQQLSSGSYQVMLHTEKGKPYTSRFVVLD